MSPTRCLLTLTLAGSLILCALPQRSNASDAGGGQAAAQQSQGGSAADRAQGRALLRQGRIAAALVRLESALKFHESENDKAGLAATHDLLGELYERQGNYDAALRHYDNAFRLFNEKKDGYNANLLLAKVGQMQARRGDSEKARATYGRMNVEKPKTGGSGFMGRVKEAAVGAAVPMISDDARVQTAAPIIAGALTTKNYFNVYRQTAIYASRELGLGRLDWRAGKYDDAREHFKNVQGTTKGDLKLIGKFGQVQRYQAAARTGLGDVNLAERRFGEAIKLYKESAEEAEKDGRFDLAWPARRGLGRAKWSQAKAETDKAKARKLKDEALAEYRLALKSVERMLQGSVRADEARATFLSTTRAVFEEASEALAEMALEGAPAGAPLAGESLAFAEESFAVVEQGRARSLLELLSESGGRITRNIPEALLKEKQENLDQQERVARLLTGVRLAGEDGGREGSDLEEEADRLHLAYENIENRIRTGDRDYAAFTDTRPLALSEVRARVLDADTALLEYSLGAENSYLWAVTRDGVTLHRLRAREAIDAQVTGLRAQILPASLRRSIVALSDADDAERGLTVRDSAKTVGDPAAFARASHQLYQTVLGPAAAFVGARRLLVVPEGALSYVPFEALLTKAGGADYATLPYLVRTNEVVYAPSASVVAALRRPGAAGANSSSRSVLIVADPVFSVRDPRAQASGADAQSAPSAPGLGLSSAAFDVAEARLDGGGVDGARFLRLKATGEEAEQIKKLATAAGLKADTLVDLEANEANVATRDLSEYRVLHFATHGLLDAERPQFTGLVLSLVGNQEQESDGFLRADEVFNLKLGSPLVMLSACETGLGKEKRGEGVLGLTRAFMYAGAPSVGVTLWSVADRSTAVLMTDFYSLLLHDGKPAPAALRDARLRMIEGKYAAPFYWAPFVLVGDWRR